MNSGIIEAIESFHGMKAEALMMKEAILKGDFNGSMLSQ
jgi:hypothetical protein